MIYIHFVLVKACRCCSRKKWQLLWEERTIETWQIIFPTTAPCFLCCTTCRQDFGVNTAPLGQWKHKINSEVIIRSSKALLHTYRTNKVFWYNHLTQFCHYVKLPGTSPTLTLISMTPTEDSWDFACTHHTSLPPRPILPVPPTLFIFSLMLNVVLPNIGIPGGYCRRNCQYDCTINAFQRWESWHVCIYFGAHKPVKVYGMLRETGTTGQTGLPRL